MKHKRETRLFSTRLQAMERCLLLNKTRGPKMSLAVVVDGPGDDEYTLMDIQDAIENDFTYEWWTA